MAPKGKTQKLDHNILLDLGDQGICDLIVNKVALQEDEGSMLRLMANFAHFLRDHLKSADFTIIITDAGEDTTDAFDFRLVDTFPGAEGWNKPVAGLADKIEAIALRLSESSESSVKILKHTATVAGKEPEMTLKDFRVYAENLHSFFGAVCGMMLSYGVKIGIESVDAQYVQQTNQPCRDIGMPYRMENILNDLADLYAEETDNDDPDGDEQDARFSVPPPRFTM